LVGWYLVLRPFIPRGYVEVCEAVWWVLERWFHDGSGYVVGGIKYDVFDKKEGRIKRRVIIYV